MPLSLFTQVAENETAPPSANAQVAVWSLTNGSLPYFADKSFFAATELTRDVLPHMRGQGSGHILNLTSIGGLISIGGFGAYCASKFALEAWSEALASPSLQRSRRFRRSSSARRLHARRFIPAPCLDTWCGRPEGLAGGKRMQRERHDSAGPRVISHMARPTPMMPSWLP